MIKKIKNKWVVLSHTTDKSFGSYKTKTLAEKRLAQIKMFGEINKKKISKNRKIS